MGFLTGPFNATQQVAIAGQALGANPSPVPQLVSPPKAPTPTAPPAVSTGGGGGGGSTYNPYARFGGIQGLNDAKNSIFNNAAIGGDQAATKYGNSITDFIHNLQTNQDALNLQGAKNELNKIQGTRDILGMVNRGIKSGGVMLANKNAANSSAAGALANAYGQLGQRQLSTVGNQYEMANQDLGVKQNEQNYNLNTGMKRFQDEKNNVVNELVQKARDSITALNQEMAYASVPDRINLEQEANRIKNELLGKLQQFDSQLASAPSNIHANTQEARRTQAQQMASAGQVADNPYQFTTEAPVQFQNTGPSAGALPIYTFPRNKQQG